MLLFGESARVVEHVQRLREELGGLARDLARDSIRRFAEHVMPRFR